MCTVVCRWQPGEPVRILALRDEFVAREFDDPGEWWPAQPGIVGGRDRVAGGTWCATSIAGGRTALLVNRIERRDGTPSRGLLPLAALAHGAAWTDQVDVTGMASFNLVLAGPDGVTVWVWDASTLLRLGLAPGTHMITSRGVDADDDKTVLFAPQFAAADWYEVVTACEPVPDLSSVVVRVPFEDRVYATVFGQLIASTPGSLHLQYSRTPWVDGSWRVADYARRGPSERLAR